MSKLSPNAQLVSSIFEQVARGNGAPFWEACHAAEAGSPRVYWHTHETNQVAMRLYDQVAERSGFVVYRKSL